MLGGFIYDDDDNMMVMMMKMMIKTMIQMIHLMKFQLPEDPIVFSLISREESQFSTGRVSKAACA